MSYEGFVHEFWIKKGGVTLGMAKIKYWGDDDEEDEDEDSNEIIKPAG